MHINLKLDANWKTLESLEALEISLITPERWRKRKKKKKNRNLAENVSLDRNSPLVFPFYQSWHGENDEGGQQRRLHIFSRKRDAASRRRKEDGTERSGKGTKEARTKSSNE